MSGYFCEEFRLTSDTRMPDVKVAHRTGEITDARLTLSQNSIMMLGPGSGVGATKVDASKGL